MLKLLATGRSEDSRRMYLCEELIEHVWWEAAFCWIGLPLWSGLDLKSIKGSHHHSEKTCTLTSSSRKSNNLCSDLQHVSRTFSLFGLELGIYYSWCVVSTAIRPNRERCFWEKQAGWLESVVAGLLQLNLLQSRTCQHTGMQRQTAAKQLHQQSRPSKHPPIGWREGGGRTCFLRRDWFGVLSKAVSSAKNMRSRGTQYTKLVSHGRGGLCNVRMWWWWGGGGSGWYCCLWAP